MYWHFLVKRDVGPTFLYQYCPLCPYESRKTNISPPKNFKTDFSIWKMLGLERTLGQSVGKPRGYRGEWSP